ncbi:MAG: response regulator [Bacillota bacterium]
MDKTRILVVDDSPFVHKLVAKALPADSYEVCGVAKNGKEALDMYAKLVPDVVTMDITMPVMNGLDASRELLATDAKVKIIMLTSRGDKDCVQKAKDIGVGVFLQKPFEPEELLRAIETICKGMRES